MSHKRPNSHTSRTEESSNRLSIGGEVCVEVGAPDGADLKQCFTPATVSLPDCVGNRFERLISINSTINSATDSVFTQQHFRVVERMPTKLPFRPTHDLQTKPLKTRFHLRLARNKTAHGVRQTINSRQLVKQKEHTTTLRKHGCVVIDQDFKRGLSESTSTQLIREQLRISTRQPNTVTVGDGLVGSGAKRSTVQPPRHSTAQGWPDR